MPTKILDYFLLCGFIILGLCSNLVAAGAEKLLKNPLLEVSQLWYRALSDTQSRMTSTLASVVDLVDFSNWTTYCFLVVICAVLFYLQRIIYRPINRIKKLGDVGYITDGFWTAKEVSNLMQRRPQGTSLPPVYPNGWFGLLESFRLKKNEALPINVMGEALAVFRDSSGDAHVIDAYCPHMGANMAAGGRVIGDCIECPFHGWRFRGMDGKCTSIPYAEKVPDMAKVKAWPTLEVNGWIHFWYHAEKIEPNWTLSEIEEIKSGSWTYRGRTEHVVNCHIEEIPENGADVQHLSSVHGKVMFAGGDLRYMWAKLWSFAFHDWDAQWTQNPAPDEHIGSIEITHKMRVMGSVLPGLSIKVDAKQIGPGVVYLKFNSPFGPGAYLQYLTPIGPLMQKVTHNIYMHWASPTLYAKFLMFAEAIQVERDIMIWNNKRYEPKPLWAKSKEDALVSRHRRWFSQFYSENSPRFKFQSDSMEW